MDELKLSAMQESLQEVREEVHRALARLDNDFHRLMTTRRNVEIQAETVRDTAYDALAKLHNLDKQLRDLTDHK